MKVTSSMYDKNDDSIESLTAKSKDLSKTLEQQENKVSTLTAQYHSLSVKNQENINKHLELYKQLKAAREELQEVAQASGKTSEEYAKQEKVVQDLEADYKRSSTAIEANKKVMSNARTELNKAQADYNNTTKEIEKNETALKESKTAYTQLTDTISKQETKLGELKKQYANTVLETGKNSKEAKSLAKEITTLNTELNTNKKKLENTTKGLDDVEASTKKVNDGFTTWKGTLSDLASSAIKSLGRSLSNLTSSILDVGINFDSAMSQVSAISGATGDDLDRLREKAKEMGAATKFTATESAEAFNYMAMAGWKTEDMLDGIAGIMNLAAASGEDLATTSDIVTDALTAMGYSAEDAGRLADVMAAASSNANTNVGMMGATFQYAAPIVGALGYTMEDTAVAIGLMANAGIKGEKAGTALRSVLTRLSAPPKECADAMEQLGISITDTDGKMKPLETIINELRSAFDGLGEAEQTQLAKSLAGQEAMSGLLAIVNAAPEDYDKLTEAVKNSAGSAEDMANTMNDNLGGQLTLLKSKLEGIALTIFEKLQPSLSDGLSSFEEFVNSVDWQAFADNVGKAIGKVVDAFSWIVNNKELVVGAVGVMLGAFAVNKIATFATNLSNIIKLFQSWELVTKAQAAAQAILNAVMSANPIGLVVLAVAALVGIFILLWNKCEGFRNFWIGLWDTIKEVSSVAWEGISGFFTGALDLAKDTWGSIVDFFSGLWQGIKDIFSTIANWINDNVFEPIKNFFEPVITFFKEAWSIISELAEGCWLIIKRVWEVVSGWFNDKVVTPVKNFFTKLWDNIKKYAETAWNFYKGIWEKASGWFNDKVIKPVQNFFTGMWDKLKTGASEAWEGIKRVFSPVIDWFKDKFSKAWEAVKNVFSVGGKVFDGIKEGITNAFKTIVNAIIRGINNVIAIPFNAINNALDKIRNIEFLGISPFKNLISRFSVPQIPELAKGGVLKRGQIGLLEGNGAEAVVPLEQNTKWIKRVANELRNSIPAVDSNRIGTTQTDTYNNMVDAFKEALTQVKIILDDEAAGKFVEKTVARAIYT